ncbi:MAG: magnesium transporter CorA family protein [Clostridiales bacterium]|nr:magnesium transporter CorA family protein [Clostridiales bacterium]
MTNCYITRNNYLEELTGPEPGCWVNLVAPGEAELNRISNKYNLDMDALKAALDEDERSRIETDENYTMILVNIPTIEDETDKELYSTIPLSIIVVDEAVITVCSEETPILSQFANGRVRDFYSNMKSRFILQILYKSSSLFLTYLRNIDKKSDHVENELHKSQKNKELIELLILEKSLVYFTTALKSNEVVLEKLLRLEIIKKYPEDSELLEDVIVENKQAIEMANIYSGILSGTMDAFASVISNNLNIVMKVLSVVTIVLSIPTLIFSAYGMNTNLAGMPFAESQWGFLIIVVISIVVSVIAMIVFMKAKFLK